MPVPGAAGDVDMPSCLGAALACFEEDGFVKDCKAALNAKIKSSRSDPEKQRDEAVVIIMRKLDAVFLYGVQVNGAMPVTVIFCLTSRSRRRQSHKLV